MSKHHIKKNVWYLYDIVLVIMHVHFNKKLCVEMKREIIHSKYNYNKNNSILY